MLTVSGSLMIQCVECEGFRMTAKSAIHSCVFIDRIGYSPSPTFERQCKKFKQAEKSTVDRRRKALRDMGSIKA
jgi:hypothetical protein